MFTLARKHAPCILFIYEIDAVGRKKFRRSFRARKHSEPASSENGWCVFNFSIQMFLGDKGMVYNYLLFDSEVISTFLTDFRDFQSRLIEIHLMNNDKFSLNCGLKPAHTHAI
jgi:SpoVK/Ycf46/Vps4 family AAA+-type ATPase